MNFLGFDVAVFGDNHRAFSGMSTDGCTVVINPGCLIPRKSDERRLGPSVYLLHDDSTVERVKLDTSEDKWVNEDVFDCLHNEDVEGISRLVEEMGSRLIEELGSLASDSLDFEAAVRRYCDQEKVDPAVRDAIMQSMGAEE